MSIKYDEVAKTVKDGRKTKRVTDVQVYRGNFALIYTEDGMRYRKTGNDYNNLTIEQEVK